MTGEKKSPAETNMNSVVEELDKYEIELGLPEHKIPESMPSDIKECIIMDRDQLNKLNPEDCLNKSYIIYQFCFFLQREINKEKAREQWAVAETTKYVHDKLNNYTQFGNEYRIQSIAAENSYVGNMLFIQNKSKRRTIRLEHLGVSLKNLADTLKDISRAKLSNLKNERASTV